MHLRIAAGAMLSAGLVVGSGGGAIAVADTDAGSSTGSSAAAGSATETATPSDGPTTTIADSLRKAVETSLQGTVQAVTGTLNSVSKPGQLPSHIPASPKTTFGGTPTVYGSTGPLSSTTDDVTTDDVTAVAAPPTVASEAPAALEAAPVLEAAIVPKAAPDLEPIASPSPKPTPTTSVAVPAYVSPNPFLAASTAVAPITNAFNAMARTLFTAPAVIAGLPRSTTPVSDLLTYFQSLLTSVGYAGTSLSQLPADLVGLLGVEPITAPAPTIGASTGVPALRAARSIPVTAPGWSALPQLPSLPPVEAGPAASPLPVPSMPLDFTTSGVASDASGTGSALTVAKSEGTNDVLSTVEHVIGAFVATVSLTALAAVALPGLLGLLSTCAAGIRVGYRHAKAGTELPATVISRFVGSGPIGVVRSGAQIELRMRAPRITRTGSRDEVPTRALRVVRSESSSTAHLLDHAV